MESIKSELLTTGDVGHAAGVSPDWVRRLVNTGRLPATRTVGGQILISLEVVEDYIRRRGERIAARAARKAERVRERGGQP